MEKSEGEKALEAEQKVRQRRGLGPKDELAVPKLWARVNESGGDVGTENYDLVYRPMCLDAHPTVQGMVLALAAPEERRLERSLAMVAMACINIIVTCSQMLGRNDWKPVREELFTMLGVNAPKIS
jgi:hypothetical protein